MKASQSSDHPAGNPGWRRIGRIIRINLITFAIFFVVMYMVFPNAAKWIVFDLILRDGWYLGPWGLLAYAVLRYNRKHAIVTSDSITEQLGLHRRPIAVGVTLVTLCAMWTVLVIFGSEYLTFKLLANTFTERGGLVASNPEFVRFTPRDNACTEISNSISNQAEHVECGYVEPMITDHGFAYVSTIAPAGVINTFTNLNPGYVFLDDSYKAEAAKKKISRIDEVQHIGLGVELRNNLIYKLAHTDFFADFDPPHYLALDPAKPTELTLVAPRTKYAYFFRLPYWGGDVLVHADGTIEDLTAEQVLADPRLKGKWVYPLSLSLHYVYLQNYAAGYGLLNWFVNQAGKFKIEDLPGDNQFPFLTYGADNNTYLVTAAKGSSTAKGLFRMYYMDAYSGVGTYHQFGAHEIVYGAEATLARHTNITDFQWKTDKGGIATAIEAVYIVRPNDLDNLYWKYTITNETNQGIAATFVGPAGRPDEIGIFKRRADFEEWMRSGGNLPAASTNVKALLEQSLAGVEQSITELRRTIEQMPSH